MPQLLNETIKPNDIFINLLVDKVNIGFLSDSNLFWIASILIFISMYFILDKFTELKKSYRIVISLLPAILMDLLLSFGSFTFHLPIINIDYTISRGVMFINLLNSIFSYKIFSYYAEPILNPFITISPKTSSSILIDLLILLYVSIDSIIELIFLTYLTFSIITIIEDRTGHQIKYQLPISVAIASVPVILYTIFISNPLLESERIIQDYNGILLFFDKGNISDIIFLFILLLINISLISTIVLIFIDIGLAFYWKINWNKRDIEFIYDFGGIALMYSLTYSIIFLLHSDFKWYAVFPMFLVYNYFRSKSKTIIDGAKERISEKEKVSHMTRSVVEQIKNPNKNYPTQVHDEFSYINIFLSVVLLVAAVLIYLFYYK